MKMWPGDDNWSASRALAIAGLVGAFLFAVVLSAAPQLHERIHQPTGASHECVVTLLTAGNCQHTSCDSIANAVRPPEPSFAFFCSYSDLASARSEFSLLEHAPPSIS